VGEDREIEASGKSTHGNTYTSSKKHDTGRGSNIDSEKEEVWSKGNSKVPLALETKPSTHDNSSLPLVPEDELAYPEGGIEAWLVVLGGWCGMFCSLGIASTLATFQAYVLENQLSSYSASQVGWTFSIWTFLTFAYFIYVDPLFDVYGPG
jgi:hypothetical protein